jgi:predicted nucleotidyltransferase
MPREELIETLKEMAQEDGRVQALFLGGSLGQGAGDDHSDIDLILVVEPQDHKAFVEGARAWLDRVVKLVHWFEPHPGLPLFSTVTQAWARIDLTVTVPGQVHGAKDRLKVLTDRAGLYDALPDRLAPRTADPGKIEAMVCEFLRVLGLLTVAVGRQEWASAVTGAGLLRQHLITLLIEQLDLPAPPGIKHLARLLPPQDLELVTHLPLAEANRESVIAVNLAYARLFLPRARALCERLGAAWPTEFEAATRAHLRRELGVDWDGPALDVV